MTTEVGIPVSGSSAQLRAVQQSTTAGMVDSEAVFLADPTDPTKYPGVTSPWSISGPVGSTLGAVNVGQQISNTTPVQISGTSLVPSNGILVQALSTNTASVFIGGSSVTKSGTTGGFELQPGQCAPFTPTNLNLLYVIGSNNTDGVCFNVL